MPVDSDAAGQLASTATFDAGGIDGGDGGGAEWIDVALAAALLGALVVGGVLLHGALRGRAGGLHQKLASFGGDEPPARLGP